MRRGVYGRISAEARRKSLRWGDGSGMRIVSRWQLGAFVEYISLRRGWEVRAVEWSVGAIGKVECVEYGKVGALISIMGVCVSTPAVIRICEEA